ncbi:unnamed protein product [Cylindrotheca closterium]|uniref:Protochlorophyllide reductase n=1 Tax=Cylindrotheca closterium TaxID=2856 RepID=A0AAD2CRY9_9STRA|nr:unnamed protein product [Cylindrotheca closterium]
MAAFVPFDNWNDYRTTSIKRVEGKDLSGKVMVITGATGSLGKEMAFALVSAGATVIMTGRTMAKLEKAKTDVLSRSDSASELKGSIELMELDLGSYDSIQAFVAALQKAHGDGIDVFVNNAGYCPTSEFKASKYDVELSFQSNFLSLVLLTELVLPLVTKKNGRLVHLTSMSHGDAPKPMDFTKIPSTKETFGGYNKDYAESKWLVTAYSAMLAKRGVTSVCADPGASPGSAMWDNQPLMIRIMARYVFRFLTKTATQAAACPTYLAVADTVESGGYYASGVQYSGREDTNDPKEWAKVTEALAKTFPEKYQKYAIKVE